MMNDVPPPGEAKRRKRKRKAPEIAKELERWWREAVSEVKMKYETLAAENKATYLEEKANDEGNSKAKKAKGAEE